ncbi:hypothetical protein EIP91_011326, partial [Steccherinum ochraceum]
HSMYDGRINGLWTECPRESDGTKQLKPNWVGWLSTEFYGSPSHHILVYDYAVGGATVVSSSPQSRITCVTEQIQDQFLPHVGKKPDWAPWTASDSLFVTWIGINDMAHCMSGEYDTFIRQNLNTLFQHQTSLYNAGARNFLFIDLPPIHLCPRSRGDGAPFRLWNTILAEYVATFAAQHDEATTMVFSSYRTFSEILADPKRHGFENSERALYCRERACGFLDAQPAAPQEEV